MAQATLHSQHARAGWRERHNTHTAHAQHNTAHALTSRHNTSLTNVAAERNAELSPSVSQVNRQHNHALPPPKLNSRASSGGRGSRGSSSRERRGDKGGLRDSNGSSGSGGSSSSHGNGSNRSNSRSSASRGAHHLLSSLLAPPSSSLLIVCHLVRRSITIASVHQRSSSRHHEPQLRGSPPFHTGMSSPVGLDAQALRRRRTSEPAAKTKARPLR